MRATARRHAGRRRRAAAASPGLLTERDLRFVADATRRVAERMTPVDALVVHAGRLARRGRAADGRHKIKKLPLVDDGRPLLGLMTARDIRRAAAPAVCDARRPGPASRRRGDRRHVATISSAPPSCSRRRRRARHRHRARPFDGDGARASRVPKRFADVELIAGNVATAEGARFPARSRRQRREGRHRPGRRLHDAADHQLRRAAAPGARRLPAGGRRARRAAHRRRRHRRHGGIAMALLFGGDTVMLGSAFAGTRRRPARSSRSRC